MTTLATVENQPGAGSAAAGIAVDAANVYWSNHSTIMKVAK